MVAADPKEDQAEELGDFDAIDGPPEDFHGDGDDDGEPIRWTTVATYWQPAEAHIARIKLESEDIDCVIVDENVIATQWLWANALGGIKLQVPVDDVIRARELLTTQVQRSIAGNTENEPLYDGLERCPRCGSDDIH